MVPVVMVRSHNKLDSLGVEYGRLGSALFVDSTAPIDVAKPRLLTRLLEEMRRALRLLGGAALPAHFPPYVGGPNYRALTDKRVARICRMGEERRASFQSDSQALQLNFITLTVSMLPWRPPNRLTRKRPGKSLNRCVGTWVGQACGCGMLAVSVLTGSGGMEPR